jgi:lipopolysaccharide transport system ATP-binding protein
MSSDPAIRCARVGKAYQLYARRTDRLKQLAFGGFRRFYQEYWVLHDINLEVQQGECLGVIGRNGTGKTTLLQLICGITLPTSGELRVTGRIAPILALGAGFEGDLSGRENVLIGAAVLGLRRREILRRLPSIAEFAAIGPFIDQPVRLYSSGMRARLAFAICAHADADVMVVDEALSVGDAAFQHKCIRFMESFRRGGTLIVVSHDLGQIASLCNRVIWIDGGRIRASGCPSEVIQRYSEAADHDQDDGARFRFATAAQTPAPPTGGGGRG